MHTSHISENLQEEIREFLSRREANTAFIIRGKIARRHARTDKPRRYFTIIVFESKNNVRSFWHDSKTYWFLKESEPWREARKSDLDWIDSVSKRIDRLIEMLCIKLGTKRQNIEIIFELSHRTSIENLLRNRAIRTLINTR